MITFGFAVLFVVFSAVAAHADLLTGKSVLTTSGSIVHDGVSRSVYVSPMSVTNHTTGQDPFLLFCGDYTTATTKAFQTTGHEYNAYAMGSSSVPFYSDQQKEYVNALFGHAYSTAFDPVGTITNTVYASAIQLAIWSILHETENYDILSGNFHVASSFNANIVQATNNLLNAVLGNVTWGSLGMADFVDYDLTVYVAEGGKNISQTFISVTGSPNREPAVVPEPATLVMFGLGLIGLAAARRQRK